MSIHEHAFKGNATKLGAALKKKPGSVDDLSADRGQSALYSAARFGHLDCVELLVGQYGADVDRKNSSEDKSTPLHGAAYGGSSEIVAYLLKKGAKVTKNAHGETPQDNAKSCVDGVTTAEKNKMKRLLDAASGAKKRVERSSDEDEDDNDNQSSSKTKKAKKTKAGQSATEQQEEQQQQQQENSRFYNQVARTRAFGTDAKRDKYGNVAGALGDLGNDDAFKGWNMLIFHRVPFGMGAQKALTKKGWKLKLVESEQACVTEMKKGIYDVVMVISQGSRATPRKDFVKMIHAHHDEGKGLLIAADNEPLFAEANAILERFDIKLTGNTPGDKVLQPGNPRKAGHFDSSKHMITAGIDAAIYEGVTICYPEGNLDDSWTVFGQSTDNHPVLISTSDEYAGGPGKPGRIVIDCGFTKFYDGYFERGAATDRYLTNAVTWLANVERSEESAQERQ